MDGKDKIFYINGKYSKLLDNFKQPSSRSLPRLSLRNAPSSSSSSSSSALDSVCSMLNETSHDKSGPVNTINADLIRTYILKQDNIEYIPAKILTEEKKQEPNQEVFNFQNHVYKILKQRDNIEEYTQGDFESRSVIVTLLSLLGVLSIESNENFSSNNLDSQILGVMNTDHAFTYINNEKELCGFCIAYSKENTKYWMMSITRNVASDNRKKLFFYWISPALHDNKVFSEEKRRLQLSLHLTTAFISANEMATEVKRAVQSDECYSIYESLLDETKEIQIQSIENVITLKSVNFISGRTVFQEPFIKLNSNTSSRSNSELFKNKRAKALNLQRLFFLLLDACFFTDFADQLSRQFFYNQLTNHRYYHKAISYYPVVLTVIMMIFFCIIFRYHRGIISNIPKTFYIALCCAYIGTVMISFSFTSYNYLTNYGTPIMLFFGMLLYAHLKNFSNTNNNCLYISKKSLVFIQSLGAATLLFQTLSIRYFEMSSFAMKIVFSTIFLIIVLFTVSDLYQLFKTLCRNDSDIEYASISTVDFSTDEYSLPSPN
jgi:hypothetical protein